MHDDIKQLFAYMAAPPVKPSSSDSSVGNASSDEDEDPNNQSMVWAHNSTSEHDGESEPEDVELTETAALSPVRKPIIDDDVSDGSSNESDETGYHSILHCEKENGGVVGQGTHYTISIIICIFTRITN
jgi:hypothetical protein